MNHHRIKLAIAVLEELHSRNLDEGWDVHHITDALNEGLFPQRDTLDMRHWGGTKLDAKHCGTVACMAGWLCLDNRMNDEGLRPFGHTDDGNYDLMPTYDSSYSYTALEGFFDISNAEVEHVFGHEQPNDLEAGIGRLKALLE